MPTMGNEIFAGAPAVSGRVTFAGLFGWRADEDFFFIRLLFSTLNHGIFDYG